MTDDELLDRLVQAAAAAIRNERHGISYDRARLRGIYLELNVFNGGAIVKGECYVNRTANLRRILGKDVPVPAGEG